MRTTAAAVGVLTPVLAAASIAGVVVQGHELTRATASVAEEQARLVAGQVGSGDGPAQVDPAGGLGDDSMVQVVGPQGVVNASPTLRGRPPLTGRPAAGSTTETTVDGPVGGESDRFLAVAVGVDGSASYVVAVRSLESVDAATASTTGLLVVGVPAVLALVAVLTWLLAGRALAPVDELRRTADAISVTGSGVRLPRGSSDDEVARLADTLNEMLERLDASARSQRQFVADASHELRSPVAAIRTVMEVSATVPVDAREIRADVLAETARLETLVDGLLALARHDALADTSPTRTQVVDLVDVVDEQAGRPRRTSVTVATTDAAYVRGNPAELGLLVGCLLDNADRHAERAVQVGVSLEPETVEVVVQDDGPGVPEAERERIFDRFVRLDAARSRDAGGAGLGLAIARAVAAEHGGSLVCDPPQTGTSGARFTLVLPRETAGPTAFSSPSAVPYVATRSGSIPRAG
jgi:signal transduction histidine kinase